MGRLPLPKMHYQQYGAPVSRVNRIGLLQMVGAGHLVRTVNHEFQYGTQYLWPRRPAVNLLSVAAGDVHGARCACKRQTGGALHSAVVTVKKTSNHIHLH